MREIVPGAVPLRQVGVVKRTVHQSVGYDQFVGYARRHWRMSRRSRPLSQQCNNEASNAVVTTTIKLRFDCDSTAI